MLSKRSAEIKRAYETGRTLRDLADEYGISRQRVQQIAHWEPPEHAYGVYIYPNIREWMRGQTCSLRELANRCELSEPTLSKFLRGVNGATKHTIDRILAVTGLKYEEAFYTEGKNDDA